MLNETTLLRLAFIKYLCVMGIDQCNRTEPYAAASILTLHDSVELFLQLACEHLQVATKESSFMQYWELLEPKLPESGLSQKESMRRLNKSRVALKHHGTMPSKLDIDSFRVTVWSFFEENTPTIFGTEFSDISLVNVVACLAARTSLQESLALMNDDKVEDALDRICIGFHHLLDDYESDKLASFYRSAFFFGESLTFDRVGENDEYDRLLNKLRDSVEAMQTAMKILALGLDYRRYVLFQAIAPIVHRTSTGQYIVSRIPRDAPLRKDDCQFCLDFVIESALRLQQFDFQIELDSALRARRITRKTTTLPL